MFNCCKQDDLQAFESLIENDPQLRKSKKARSPTLKRDLAFPPPGWLTQPMKKNPEDTIYKEKPKPSKSASEKKSTEGQRSTGTSGTKADADSPSRSETTAEPSPTAAENEAPSQTPTVTEEPKPSETKVTEEPKPSETKVTEESKPKEAESPKASETPEEEIIAKAKRDKYAGSHSGVEEKVRQKKAPPSELKAIGETDESILNSMYSFAGKKAKEEGKDPEASTSSVKRVLDPAATLTGYPVKLFDMHRKKVEDRILRLWITCEGCDITGDDYIKVDMNCRGCYISGEVPIKIKFGELTQLYSYEDMTKQSRFQGFLRHPSWKTLSKEQRSKVVVVEYIDDTESLQRAQLIAGDDERLDLTSAFELGRSYFAA